MTQPLTLTQPPLADTHTHAGRVISITNSAVRVLHFFKLITHTQCFTITQDINGSLTTVLLPVNKRGGHGANRVIRLPMSCKLKRRRSNERTVLQVSYLPPHPNYYPAGCMRFYHHPPTFISPIKDWEIVSLPSAAGAAELTHH